MKRNYLLAGITIFLWSTISTVSKLLLEAMNSFQVLCVSALFAFLFLFLWNLFRGNLKACKRLSLKDYGILALIGLPGTFLYYVFLYSGTARMAASQAFIINYLWPIMSVSFAVLLIGERMTARKSLAIALSFLGVAVVAGEGLLGFQTNTLMGALFCILAAISYGLFTALNQKYSYDKSIATMVSCFVSFLLSLVICLATGAEFDLTLGQVGGLAWNGIFVMGVATTLWAIALESGNTARISNLAYITPFLSLVWNLLVLKETPSPFAILGLILIPRSKPRIRQEKNT